MILWRHDDCYLIKPPVWSPFSILMKIWFLFGIYNAYLYPPVSSFSGIRYTQWETRGKMMWYFIFTIGIFFHHFAHLHNKYCFLENVIKPIKWISALKYEKYTNSAWCSMRLHYTKFIYLFCFDRLSPFLCLDIR